MTTSITAPAQTLPAGGVEPLWLPRSVWVARGFHRHGSEIDYGMRWGTDRDIRVSFAPYPDPSPTGEGMLYAYQARSDRFTMLAVDTTPEQASAAFRYAVSRSAGGEPIDYMHLARCIDADTPEHALTALTACLQREIAAADAVGRRLGSTRSESAERAADARALRMAAEDVRLALVRDRLGVSQRPVVAGYRIDAHRPIVGAVAGCDLEDAVSALGHVQQAAGAHRARVRVTSLEAGERLMPVGPDQRLPSPEPLAL